MGENPYLKAIHHPDRAEQLEAFEAFATGEMERSAERLAELENDDGSIPEDNAGQWNYEKGKLDFCRTVAGMFAQARMAAELQGGENRDDGERQG